jgi:hypothetical protein
MKIGHVAMEVAGRVGMTMKKTRHVVVVVVVTMTRVGRMMGYSRGEPVPVVEISVGSSGWMWSRWI